MSPDDPLDAWLGSADGEVPEPTPEAEDQTVAAVRERFTVRTRRSWWPLAAAALVLIGIGLGFWWGRNGAEPTRLTLTAASADHERRVFEEARRGLGEELAWLASNEGHITLGLTREQPEDELRVVFLEIRDASGNILSRPRVVVPDGRASELRLAGLPAVNLRATKQTDETIELECEVAFEDGTRIAAAPVVLERGRQRRLGETERSDGPVALLASVD